MVAHCAKSLEVRLSTIQGEKRKKGEKSPFKNANMGEHIGLCLKQNRVALKPLKLAR